MRVKLFTAFFTLFLVAQKISAQKDTAVYFFDKDLQAIDAENNATYIGKAFEQKPFWKLIITNRQTGKIILKSYYSDSNLTHLESAYEVFFDNGKPKITGSYQAGIEDGTWKTWNERNILTDSIVYKNGEMLFRENSVYNDHGILTSYQLHDNVTKRKINKNYFPSGALKDSSAWLDKKGELKLYYENGGMAQLAQFDEKGKRIFLQYYKEDGTAISEKEYSKIFEKKLEDLRQSAKEKMPEFLGGDGQLGIFFQKNLKLPSAYTNTIHQNQRITFSFMLNEKGKAYDPKMVDPLDDEFLHAIEDMLKIMPPWQMKGHKSYGPITQTINITY
jgi:antitoxin component YwqK of YwqJK toxin-antitoxin module